MNRRIEDICCRAGANEYEPPAARVVAAAIATMRGLGLRAGATCRHVAAKISMAGA